MNYVEMLNLLHRAAREELRWARYYAHFNMKALYYASKADAKSYFTAARNCARTIRREREQS